MDSFDYCEVDSGNNITSCNVALLIRVRNFSAISSGIDGIYPLLSVKNGGQSNPQDMVVRQTVHAMDHTKEQLYARSGHSCTKHGIRLQ